MPAFSFESLPPVREPNTGELDEQGEAFSQDGEPESRRFNATGWAVALSVTVLVLIVGSGLFYSGGLILKHAIG